MLNHQLHNGELMINTLQNVDGIQAIENFGLRRPQYWIWNGWRYVWFERCGSHHMIFIFILIPTKKYHMILRVIIAYFGGVILLFFFSNKSDFIRPWFERERIVLIFKWSIAGYKAFVKFFHYTGYIMVRFSITLCSKRDT